MGEMDGGNGCVMGAVRGRNTNVDAMDEATFWLFYQTAGLVIYYQV